ncbi:MAG: hypothetical protein ACXWTP_06610 [Methylosarcina sp.]
MNSGVGHAAVKLGRDRRIAELLYLIGIEMGRELKSRAWPVDDVFFYQL